MKRAGAPSDAETLARVRLWLSAGIGPVTWLRLVEAAGSGEAAVSAFPELVARAGARGRVVLADIGAARAELAAMARAGARAVCLGDEDYPALLAGIEGAPAVLVARGDMALAAALPVAVIGARNASPAGVRLARQFAGALAGAGHAVVSGLARGIDAAAHQAALDAGGPTVGVIASGIDIAYPPEHAGLQARIAAEGLLLCDVPCGTEPVARRFPARNRVIAAMSLGVVVVEAAPQSGSLLTAGLAAEFGREVMAIPGSPLDPRSRGCNALIRDGAVLVQGADEVIELVTRYDGGVRFDAAAAGRAGGGDRTVRPGRDAGAAGDLFASAAAGGGGGPVAALPPADLAGELCALMGPVPLAVDELVRITGAATAAVQMALVELELAGRVERHAGGRVALAY